MKIYVIIASGYNKPICNCQSQGWGCTEGRESSS
jgi:hypothetical protein